MSTSNFLYAEFLIDGKVHDLMKPPTRFALPAPGRYGHCSRCQIGGHYALDYKRLSSRTFHCVLSVSLVPPIFENHALPLPQESSKTGKCVGR